MFVLKTNILLALILILNISNAYCVTTRVDNEYFYFKHTEIYAIKKNNKWIKSSNLLKIGLIDDRIVLDASGAKNLIPDKYRLKFYSNYPKKHNSFNLPSSYLENEDVQQCHLYSKKNNSKVTLWLTGRRWNPIIFKYSNIELPKKSVSFGLIQFSCDNHKQLVEFAIEIEEYTGHIIKKKTIGIDKLQIRNNVAYVVNVKTPFSGTVIEKQKLTQFFGECSKGIERFENYIDGLKSGLSKEYLRTKDCIRYLHLSKNYKENLLNGTYKKFFPSGQICEEGEYINDHKFGIWKYWHKNGYMQKKITYQEDSINGLYEEWEENGKKIIIANYLDGELFGKNIKWDSNGKLIHAGYFIKDVWFQFDKNNNLRIISSKFKAGHYSDNYYEFYPNGQLLINKHIT
ncbi:hypothetical protein MHK_008042, partial [Candidatus Magnetomorum sp. HK-1]